MRPPLLLGLPWVCLSERSGLRSTGLSRADSHSLVYVGQLLGIAGWAPVRKPQPVQGLTAPT